MEENAYCPHCEALKRNIKQMAVACEDQQKRFNMMKGDKEMLEVENEILRSENEELVAKYERTRKELTESVNTNKILNGIMQSQNSIEGLMAFIESAELRLGQHVARGGSATDNYAIRQLRIISDANEVANALIEKEKIRSEEAD